ncbi:MAG: pantoate--beta-alanine ligase [Verrucomicrobiales bacterium]
MDVLKTVAELRDWNRANGGNRPRVLVPTMGALHDGHLSLCDIARKKTEMTGTVVTTIFVNPTQFGPNEDLDAYPRPLEADLEKCRSHGVDAVFAPSANSEIYASDASISISETSLSNHLCGASRPGHFRGVCTVVAKLFNLTQPDAAVFGEKDFQQLAIIRRLVRDLNLPVKIIAGTTVRESDGLAMSSRNAYLSPEARAQAPIIRQSLEHAAATIQPFTFDESIGLLRKTIESAPLAKIDYIEIVDAETMQPISSLESDRPARIAAAVFFGKTRLIDNIGVEF